MSDSNLICWVECNLCSDYWCNIHLTHVYDCKCAGLEAWINLDLIPYEATVEQFENNREQLEEQ